MVPRVKRWGACFALSLPLLGALTPAADAAGTEAVKEAVAVSGKLGAVSAGPYVLQPYDPATYDVPATTTDGKPTDLRPAEIYGKARTVGIRIANGGAGYTGLLRALSEAYLATNPTIHGKPFSIAWYNTNTTFSYKAVKDQAADIGLVYEVRKEALEGNTAYASALTHIFDDAFIFIGPEVNPAGLVNAAFPQGDGLITMLEKIIAKGCATPFKGRDCAMYASRGDLSGTYRNETARLIALKTPQELVNQSPWYYVHQVNPREALKEASDKGLYTLNDKSTWVSQPGYHPGLTVYADGSDGRNPELANPCYALMAKPEAMTSDQPAKFAAWMAGPEGQAVIAAYGRDRFGAPVVRPVPRP